MAPLIAIFTPGTLTIYAASQPNRTIVEYPVPMINYSAVRQFGQIGAYYLAPSSGISRLAATVTSQGSILNIRAPYANCSYSFELFGPSLSCGPTTSANGTQIVKFLNPEGLEDPYPFVAFVPSGEGVNRTLMNQGVSECSRGFECEYDWVSEDHARLYVFVQALHKNQTGIECGLYNASHNVDISFSNEQQKLTVQTTRLNGVAANVALAICGNNDTIHNDAGVCSPSGVAYLALLNAMGQQLCGYLESSHYDGTISSTMTQVVKTAFMDTEELWDAQYIMNGEASYTTPRHAPAGAIGIAQALEETFLNLTLSLFSSDLFLYMPPKPQAESFQQFSWRY